MVLFDKQNAASQAHLVSCNDWKSIVSCHYSLWLWEQDLRYHSERWVCPTTYTGPPSGRQTPGPLRWAKSKAADPLAAVLMAHRVLHRYVLWVYEGNCFLPFCYGGAVFVKTTHNPP